MSLLAQALQDFVDSYHADDALVADQSSWSCDISLVAQDISESVHLNIEDGRVVDIGAGASGRSLVIRSDLAVLLDILEFRRDPNEPYLFGELTVRGGEDDFMRLDYIVTKLCRR